MEGEAVMRPLLDMDTIQIEITNACVRSCSNCTRFCGHHEHPYFMDMDPFKAAVDSMVGFPKMTGIMGGEPLLHPEFHEMCEYLGSKVPPAQTGFWTALPKGFEKHREIICKTFGNIFLNDHARPDIFHHPVLVAAEEAAIKGMFYLIDKCWLQNCWSAAINPNGAFFCEIAAAFSLLMGEGPGSGWPVEAEWWNRTSKDYTSQIEKYCVRCGCCLPLQRRASVDGRDDISPSNLKLFLPKSKKLQAGKYVMWDGLFTQPQDQRPMAAYKDQDFREVIAARYGILLTQNEKGFLKPYLQEGDLPQTKIKSLFEQYEQEMRKK